MHFQLNIFLRQDYSELNGILTNILLQIHFYVVVIKTFKEPLFPKTTQKLRIILNAGIMIYYSRQAEELL